MHAHRINTNRCAEAGRVALRLLASCTLALTLAGCASTQGVTEFTAYHQAYTAAAETGQTVLDRLAVAERQVFESSQVTMSADNLNFDVGNARYYVDIGDPPATASLRSSVAIVRLYNDAVVGLVSGQATEAMVAQISLVGRAAIDAGSQIAALAGTPVAGIGAVASKLVDPLKALEPLTTFVLEQQNRMEFRRRLVDSYPHVDAVLGGLIDATPHMYAVLSRPLARSKMTVTGTVPFTPEEVAALLKLRGALANWVILLQGSRGSLAVAVVAVRDETGANAAAGIVASAAELSEAARQVRRNLAALGL